MVLFSLTEDVFGVEKDEEVIDGLDEAVLDGVK